MHQTQTHVRHWWLWLAAVAGTLLLAGLVGTPAVHAGDAGTDGADHGRMVAYGLIAKTPCGTVCAPWAMIGIWTIGESDYIATDATQFNQENGSLVPGVCVKVSYSGREEPYAALKIERQNESACNGGDHGGDHGGDDHDVKDKEAYGLVNLMPDGSLIGLWNIDIVSGTITTTVPFSATASTEFQTEYGPFAKDACVKVDYFDNTTPFTAREIETEPRFKCIGGSDDDDGGDDDHGNSGVISRGEFFGMLLGLPPAYPPDPVGTWNVGLLPFAVDEFTKFKPVSGSFELSMTVKVEFTVELSPTLSPPFILHAREIKAVFGRDHDDDGHGHHHARVGHAFASIDDVDGVPNPLIGIWKIGGISYTVTAETRLKNEHGELKAGTNVRVKYYLANGNRIAIQIKSTSDRGGVADQTHYKLVSVVNSMPPTTTNSFKGTWVIADIPFKADGMTKFNEDKVALGVGAYVEVEYVRVGPQRRIVEITTQVPPTAGEDNFVGKLEDNGGALTAVAGSTWVVGGRSFTVIPSTDLDEVAGDLVAGSTVLVNSYRAADGSQVATMIETVNLSNALYMPLMSR